MKRRRRRQLKLAGIITVIFAISAGGLWYFWDAHARDAETDIEHTDIEGRTSRNSGMLTATGVTEITVEPVSFAIDFLQDTSLYVEEVYLSAGDTVEAGEQCIKLTEDSIDKARAELEREVQSAELAYRSKVISNGEDSRQAKYVYDMALLEAKHAPQIYQDTLTQLEMQLVEAEKNYRNAQEEYSAYDLAVKNNTFYEDFKLQELKKAYEEAYDLCTRRGEYWEVTEEELREFSRSSNHTTAQNDRQWIIETVALLREEALEARSEYEQAQQDYQREIEGAELKLQKLLNQFQQAEQNFTNAQIELQKGSLRAKTEYELIVAEGQIAENGYNISAMSLAGELERQKDARDRAVKNKELFEQLVGDGYLYTERAGTIAEVSAEKGQALAGGEQIFAYENPEEMYVSAAVPEQDTAMLYVGEDARVTIADCGYFNGVIRAIHSMTTSKGRDYAYSIVVVALEDDVSMIMPNMAATVVFGKEGNTSGQETVEDDTASERYVSSGNTIGHELSILDSASQMYDVDISVKKSDENANGLKVEEIYVEPGQEIKKGEPVCQFTQDSIENVRKALSQAQTEAQIALMEAQAEYHIGVLEAGLSHNEALLNASLAQTVYDNTIAKLNSDMAAKTLEIEQLLADIYQMQLALTDDDFEERRAEITKAYDQAKGQVEKVREGFVSSQVEAAQTFQAAKEAYEEFFKQSESSNQQIADKIEEIDTMQNEMLQSQQLLERKILSAEQTRISSQTKGELANVTYASSVRAYEKSVSRAQTELEHATRRLEDFNQLIGNGIIYATGDGLVVEVGCEKGDLLVDIGKLVSFVAAADVTDINEDSQEEGDTQ